MPAVLPFSPSIRHPIEGLVFNPPGSLNRTPPSDVKRRMRAIDSLQSERNELVCRNYMSTHPILYIKRSEQSHLSVSLNTHILGIELKA